MQLHSFSLTRLVSWLALCSALPVLGNEDCFKNLARISQRLTAEANALVTPAGGRFRHYSMTEYQFGKDGKYETVLYRNNRAVKPQDATVVVALLHGMNAETSHSGSMLIAMNALTKDSKNIEKDSPLDLLQKQTKRLEKVYAEAIDQPGCGNNCDVNSLHYEGMIDFYTEYFKDLRARAPGKPVVAVGFCYSAGFLVEVNRRNPGLIDGLVLTGLIVPSRKVGFDFAADVETAMYEKGTLVENPAVRARADAAYVQLPWSEAESPTGTTPTVLLIGSKDPFQSPTAYEWFQQWQSRVPQTLKYRVVPEAGHGVLMPVEGHPDAFVSVLKDINELMTNISASGAGQTRP